MELSGLKCSGCGSTDVEHVPSQRKIICNQCGKEEYYSRATISRNKNVILAKDNAIKFFLSGNLESARHYALEVLNLFADNAPALYIVHYYDEVKNARNASLEQFFTSLIQDTSLNLEYDEIRELQALCVFSAKTLVSYEKQLIQISVQNMQSPDDAKELALFIDKICPYFISRRTSSDFLDSELVSFYQELAEHLDTPRLCFALIKAIAENPESPYVRSSFSLEGKTKYFYDHFVLPIGEIVNNMKESLYKAKLRAAYTQKLNDYKQRAGYTN